ncbi:MAG: metallophosphoesterase family protein [Lentisphaeria bacterium]|nr:metallophosphoesterase family protein [Lentisphaeria bacterium]
MKKILEQYFPVMRKFPHRLALWSRAEKLLTSSRHSSRRLKVRSCVLRAPVPQAAGQKILFLSDLHWYDSPENWHLLENIEALAAKVSPDYLVLGGDMVEDADRIDQLRPVLNRLSRLADVCVAIPGNWEVGKRWLAPDFWQKFYAASGIDWLCNESRRYGAVRFHGINDISSGDCFLPEKHDPEIPPTGTIPAAEVLLAHAPDTVVALDENSDLRYYDVALCGHTHGGQIRLPLWGALFCPSRYGRFFDRGAFSRSSFHLKMVVSAGLGKRDGSFRLCCRPEALVLTFRPAHHYHLRRPRANG